MAYKTPPIREALTREEDRYGLWSKSRVCEGSRGEWKKKRLGDFGEIKIQQNYRPQKKAYI